MLGWGKKNQGFEWHKYVRTTIKVRRDQRREQAHAAKDSVLAQGKAAGVAVASLSASAAGLVWAGLRSGLAGLWLGLTGSLRAGAAGVGQLLGRGGAALQPRLARLDGTGFTGLVALAGLVAAGLAGVRLQAQGADPATLAALAGGVGLFMLAAGAWFAGGSAAARATLARLPVSGGLLAGLVALAMLLGGGVWAWRSNALASLSLPRLASLLKKIPASA